MIIKSTLKKTTTDLYILLPIILIVISKFTTYKEKKDKQNKSNQIIAM